jgi:hypothetical protein
VYPSREKGIKTRRIIEMVGALHRLGYGRLRLACSWEDAGPAPVWFGTIAPVNCFHQDHGAILARNPLAAAAELSMGNVRPNLVPMFKSRHFSVADEPWPGFLQATLEEAAKTWLARFPDLAAEGLGLDSEYVGWYERMLDATAPMGILAASCYWEPLPGFMFVSCGPQGVDRFTLPPPGGAAAS